jgi:pyruvate dehydrogenase E1 component alpha subunit
VLWVCENNQYGMGTAIDRASAVIEMSQKAEGYGMPHSKADGMNVLEVRQVTADLLAKIRAGGGPHFLEVMTYRFRGHSMGDPERYRKVEEIHHWQENDPIGVYHKYLLTNQIATEEQLRQQDLLVLDEVKEAVEFAESSPEPAPEELFRDIYVEP